MNRAARAARLEKYLTACLHGQTEADLTWANYPHYLVALSDRPSYHHAFPTSEQLAQQFLRDEEYQALRLGTWLRSPDGQLIAAVVTRVLPPEYQVYVRVIIEGLQLAARMQQQSDARDKRPLAAVIGFAVGVAALAIATG